MNMRVLGRRFFVFVRRRRKVYTCVLHDLEELFAPDTHTRVAAWAQKYESGTAHQMQKLRKFAVN